MFTCKACGFNNMGGVVCALPGCRTPRTGVKGGAAGVADNTAVVDLGASWIQSTGTLTRHYDSPL